MINVLCMFHVHPSLYAQRLLKVDPYNYPIMIQVNKSDEIVSKALKLMNYRMREYEGYTYKFIKYLPENGKSRF